MTFEEIPLNRVASVRARIGWKALTAAEYTADGYAFLNTPNIKGREIDFENTNYINQFRWDESPELQLEIGDVLLAKDGSTLGIANVVLQLPRPATVNGSIAVIRPSAVDSRFLRYCLEGSETQAAIEQLKDGMGVPHLFQRDINRLRIPNPPIEAQRRIADFLDDQVGRIDQALRLRKADLELVTERENELGNRLFSEIWASADIPRSLRSCMDFFQDGDWIEAPYLTDEGIRLIQTGNIGSGLFKPDSERYISESTFTNLRCTEVYPGDLLISRLSTPVGRACIAPDLGTRCIASVDVVICRSIAEVDARYLAEFLSSHRQLSFQNNLSRGTTMQRLSRSQVGSLKVPIPELSEQLRLIAEMRGFRADAALLRDALERQCAFLDERKRSLITAAVTGQLDVTSSSPLLGPWVSSGLNASVESPTRATGLVL